MIEILFWISIISGGLLVILLLLSLLGGLDMDFDIGGGDVETGTGGLGYIKGGLTFISVSTWVIKLVLATSIHPVLALVIGVVSGLIAIAILAGILRFLLKQQADVNWKPEDSIFKHGKVYLRIPADGAGIIHLTISGLNRELKARSKDNITIETGASILVEDYEDGHAIVSVTE